MEIRVLYPSPIMFYGYAQASKLFDDVIFCVSTYHNSLNLSLACHDEIVSTVIITVCTINTNYSLSTDETKVKETISTCHRNRWCYSLSFLKATSKFKIDLRILRSGRFFYFRVILLHSSVKKLFSYACNWFTIANSSYKYLPAQQRLPKR